jgi:hypothetical protein
MADIPEPERTKLIIDVLLHDYEAMRAEIVSRTSSRFQLMGLTAVAATLGTAKWASGWDIFWIILGTVVFGAIIWFISGFSSIDAPYGCCRSRIRSMNY